MQFTPEQLKALHQCYTLLLQQPSKTTTSESTVIDSTPVVTEPAEELATVPISQSAVAS